MKSLKKRLRCKHSLSQTAWEQLAKLGMSHTPTTQWSEESGLGRSKGPQRGPEAVRSAPFVACRGPWAAHRRGLQLYWSPSSMSRDNDFLFFFKLEHKLLLHDMVAKTNLGVFLKLRAMLKKWKQLSYMWFSWSKHKTRCTPSQKFVIVCHHWDVKVTFFKKKNYLFFSTCTPNNVPWWFNKAKRNIFNCVYIGQNSLN